MSTKRSLAEKIRTMPKKGKLVVNTNRNVASVTAHRALGEGNYTVRKMGETRSEVQRLA
jgi:hypothetical protein